MDSNGFEPTIIYDSATGSSVVGSESVDVSKANVGFVEGDRPKFTDETASLLRSRLTAATLALTVILAAAFVGSLVNGIASLWWLRGLVLCLLFGCFLSLRSGRQLSLSQLRIVELVVFGMVVLQVSLILATRIAGFAAQQDAIAVVAVKQLFLGAWCVLILIYGIFMPNTWKRGAAVMLPIALMPYVVLAIQRRWVPDVAAMLDSNNASNPIPLPIVAALVQRQWLYAIRSPNMQPHYGEDLNMHTYWILSSPKHAERSQDTRSQLM